MGFYMNKKGYWFMIGGVWGWWLDMVKDADGFIMVPIKPPGPKLQCCTKLHSFRGFKYIYLYVYMYMYMYMYMYLYMYRYMYMYMDMYMYMYTHVSVWWPTMFIAVFTSVSNGGSIYLSPQLGWNQLQLLGLQLITETQGLELLPSPLRPNPSISSRGWSSLVVWGSVRSW